MSIQNIVDNVLQYIFAKVQRKETNNEIKGENLTIAKFFA